MSTRPVILVFGAINQDEVARVTRLPTPGETVVTEAIDLFPGGKGANLAYAAAIAGGDEVTVQMVGAVGDDVAGADALRSLRNAGVDTTLVKQVVGRPTGRAYIAVDNDGQNQIVVGLGANGFVSPSNLLLARRPDIAVAQTELGSAAIEALCGFAAEVGARLVVNSAPVVDLSGHALVHADPLVVNEHEALDLLAATIWTGSVEELAETVRSHVGSRSVVITLGSAGSVTADAAGARHHAATKATRVVDTTGAGDTFIGALVAALAVGADLDHAVSRASSAAAASVAWRGARAPIPVIPARSSVRAAPTDSTLDRETH